MRWLPNERNPADRPSRIFVPHGKEVDKSHKSFFGLLRFDDIQSQGRIWGIAGAETEERGPCWEQRPTSASAGARFLERRGQEFGKTLSESPKLCQDGSSQSSSDFHGRSGDESESSVSSNTFREEDVTRRFGLSSCGKATDRVWLTLKGLKSRALEATRLQRPYELTCSVSNWSISHQMYMMEVAFSTKIVLTDCSRRPDSPERACLAQLLGRLRERALRIWGMEAIRRPRIGASPSSTRKILRFAAKELADKFSWAIKRLIADNMATHRHFRRHGGASHDDASALLNVDMIRDQELLRSPNSTKRYEKSARLAEVLGRLDGLMLGHGLSSAQRIQVILQEPSNALLPERVC